MNVPARVSFVTLAVRDLPRMATFYRQLGWPESTTNSGAHVAFLTGGAILGLFGAEHYAATFGPSPAPGAFRGVTLAINLEGPAEVDRVHEALLAADGATVHGPPEDLSFGGRGFTFSDPEGNVWDVIWTDGTAFDDRGGLIFP